MKKFLLLFICLVTACSIFCQVDDKKQTELLIVALDIRSNVEGYWSTSRISNSVSNILSRNNVNPDYVSGVLYGIKNGAPTPTGFSKLIVEPQTANNRYAGLLETLHSHIPEGTFYSITSFAKPYSLMALNGKQNTNKTFMVIITDGIYNGNDDYYGEASYVKNQFTRDGKNQFKREIKSVQTNYFCQFIDQRSIDGGYIQLYEFIPLQQYFALESVLDFPHEIVAERKKGEYQVKFPITAIKNDDYKIERLVVTVSNEDSENESESEENEDEENECEIIFKDEVTPDNELIIDIPNDKVSDAKIEIKAWVKLCDGIYNNTILHPEGSKLQGAEGLSRKFTIKLEDKAKILGILPLPDTLFDMSFWTSSQTTAANSWGWILILVAIAAVVYIIYKSNIYKPNTKEIKI
jgi:hypothetical protein